MSREKEELPETVGLMSWTLEDIKTYVEKDAVMDLEFEFSDLYEGVKKMTMLYALYLKELSREREEEEK